MASQTTMTQEQVRELLGVPRIPATSLDHHGALHSVTLPINLENDNQGRSQHWLKAKRRKAAYGAVLTVGRQKRSIPFPAGVRLVLTRILGPGQRLWDQDSVLRGSAKELIDALVGAGWFVDDSPKWIAKVEGVQDASSRSCGPAVCVEVFAP